MTSTSTSPSTYVQNALLLWFYLGRINNAWVRERALPDQLGGRTLPTDLRETLVHEGLLERSHQGGISYKYRLTGLGIAMAESLVSAVEEEKSNGPKPRFVGCTRCGVTDPEKKNGRCQDIPGSDHNWVGDSSVDAFQALWDIIDWWKLPRLAEVATEDEMLRSELRQLVRTVQKASLPSATGTYPSPEDLAALNISNALRMQAGAEFERKRILQLLLDKQRDNPWGARAEDISIIQELDPRLPEVVLPTSLEGESRGERNPRVVKLEDAYAVANREFHQTLEGSRKLLKDANEEIAKLNAQLAKANKQKEGIQIDHDRMALKLDEVQQILATEREGVTHLQKHLENLNCDYAERAKTWDLDRTKITDDNAHIRRRLYDTERRLEVEEETSKGEIKALSDQLEIARADVRVAGKELLVDLAEAPIGSTVCRLLIANRLLINERDEARRNTAKVRWVIRKLRDQYVSVLLSADKQLIADALATPILVDESDYVIEPDLSSAIREGLAKKYRALLLEKAQWQWLDKIPGKREAYCRICMNWSTDCPLECWGRRVREALGVQDSTPESPTEPAAVEDPVRMYIIVRKDLKMSVGKVAAQVGHAVQLFMNTWEFERTHGDVAPVRQALAREWSEGEYGKIVLAASDAEFDQISKEGPVAAYVIDNGHTEVPAKTTTCLALWPMKKSARSTLLKQLKCL
jgi:peptidyl-tRNA hydrolase